MNYRCATCGEIHHDSPDVGFDKPAYAERVPEHEKPGRVQLTADTCILDGETFFIRGVIEIPILNSSEHFGIGVWVSRTSTPTRSARFSAGSAT